MYPYRDKPTSVDTITFGRTTIHLANYPDGTPQAETVAKIRKLIDRGGYKERPINRRWYYELAYASIRHGRRAAYAGRLSGVGTEAGVDARQLADWTAGVASRKVE